MTTLTAISGSGKPLLEADPTKPTRRMLFGVPLLASENATRVDVVGMTRT